MLSIKQNRVFEYIQDYIKQHGYAPTVREVKEGLGYQSTSTVHNLMALIEEKGYIERVKSSPRTIKILKVGESVEEETN